MGRCVSLQRLNLILIFCATGFLLVGSNFGSLVVSAYQSGSQVPSKLPPPFPVHWYAGSVYTGVSAEAVGMVVTLTTPSSYPSSTDDYYVLLSAFDNTGSYDQVGMSAVGGLWTFTYSYTTGPCSSLTYHFRRNVLALNLSTTYSFVMETLYNSSYPKSSVLAFAAITSKDDTELSITEPDAKSLIVSKSYCIGYNYQNYEEIYSAGKNGTGVPGFSFQFLNDGWCVSVTECNSASWAAWKAPYNSSYTVPEGVKVSISGSSVAIHN